MTGAPDGGENRYPFLILNRHIRPPSLTVGRVGPVTDEPLHAVSVAVVVAHQPEIDRVVEGRLRSTKSGEPCAGSGVLDPDPPAAKIVATSPLSPAYGSG